MSETKTKKVGTCQCCFNLQVVGTEPYALVLHGYTRPGVGWINGRCAGVGHLPYELSCEQTKHMAVFTQAQLDVQHDRLADIEKDRNDSYTIEVTDYDAPRRYGFQRSTKPFTVTRGFDDIIKGYGSTTFERVRQQKLAEQKAAVESTRTYLLELKKRIRDWKLAPEALRTHEAVEREKRAATEAARAAKAAEREAKAKAKAERPLPKRKFEVLRTLLAKPATLQRGDWSNSIDLGDLARRGFARREVSGGKPYEDTYRETFTITDAGRAAIARQEGDR